jgi:Sec-independent protein secretion pathway component TatC
MAGEAESTAGAPAAPRSSGGWKALGLFPLAWLGWWSLRGELLTSYAAIALAFVAVRFALLPYLLRPLAPEANGLLALGDYLHVVGNLFAAQAVGAQLAVVLLFSTLQQRARGEAGSRTLFRLLGLSGGALLVGALLTPPDPFSQLLFSLPLIALAALAALAGHFFGASPAAPAASKG